MCINLDIYGTSTGTVCVYSRHTCTRRKFGAMSIPMFRASSHSCVDVLLGMRKASTCRSGRTWGRHAFSLRFKQGALVIRIEVAPIVGQNVDRRTVRKWKSSWRVVVGPRRSDGPGKSVSEGTPSCDGASGPAEGRRLVERRRQ